MKIIYKLITSSLLALLSVSAQANLLTNGSFESNAQANGSWSNYANLIGWTGGAHGIELRDNVAGAAFDGLNYVELDTTVNSSMSQNVATNAGETYTLSFAYSPRAGVAAASNGIAFSWNGVQIAALTGNGSGAGNVWQIYSYTVTAIGATSNVAFAAYGLSDGVGGSLDAVKMTAVPEPTSVALFALGLFGLALLRRRKQ